MARGIKNNLAFLAGGGEMGERIRAMDWAGTPLGPVERWPQSLRSAVSIMLPSKAQIAMFWGEELITLYNDAYRPVFGAKHPDALGKPIRESWRELWQAGLKELFDGVLATGDAFWAQARPFFMERHGYLEETYFDVSYDPIRDESGRVAGLFCIVNEVTGRVVGERRLRLLRDLRGLAQQARGVADAYRAAAEVIAGYPEDIAFALLYGAERPGEPHRLLGRSGFADDAPAAPPAQPAELLVLDAKKLRGAPLHAGPWPEPLAEAAVLPLSTPGEEAQGFLVAGISTRRRFDADYRDFLNLVASTLASVLAAARRSEDERRRADMLAELDRAKTTFFSNVSHEFRTPLTLMLGPLEEELREVPGRPRLELAHRNALRLLKLVNTLLDFSRIEAGRAQASYEETDLAALTAELASSFRSAMEKAGLAFTVDCPPLATAAWVDRDMWEKIVLNLLSNAFKHTFEGEVRVSLRAKDAGIELQVSDTGTGIPAAELPRVFERFRRVEGARSRTHEGTGIGLALVQELVRLHGGAVEVESTEGKGSTFRVTLPAGKAHLPAERIGAARALAATGVGAQPFVEEALRWLPEKAGAAEPAVGKRKRIVWADDNADMREYVRGLLAPHYDVVAVADGEAALKAVRAAGADLVLADVMMPRVDGLELVRRLRAEARTAAVPVLLVSARAGEEARIEGLDAGADDYLYKPFSARELLARVGALVRAAELRAEAQRAASALAESERKLQTLIASLPGMAYRCPLESPWPLTFASEGVLELTGYPSEDFVAGRRTWGELIHVDDAAGVESEVGQAIAANRPFEMIYRIRDAQGRLRWVLDRGRPVADRSGGPPAAIEGFVLDLTRQREADDALREADRRKDVFLATLSHELRNPIAPLKNALALLRAGGLSGAESEDLRAMMERQVDHLVRLVDDLLEVTRITTGALELRRERVEAAAVVRSALETARPLTEARRHALDVSLPPAPLWLDGDPVRLAQILSNLLNNAAKFTPAGGRIGLAVRREGDLAAFEVSDTGAGISADALPRIFQMFARDERTRRQEPEGLGIGLAIARRLAEMHGGTLQAASEGPGRGAVFTLRVPVMQPAQAAAPSSLSLARNRVARLNQRILVVDDNQDAASSLGMLLRAFGADVVVAHSGPQALERFGEAAPDVVLLDIGMPGMDGYEVARRMRSAAAGRRARLIALTGWGQEGDRRRAVEAGFDHHLVKPVDAESLHALLARH